MSILRKLFILVLLASMLAAIVPAMAQDAMESPVTLPETINNGEPVTITVMAGISDDTQQELWDAQVARFNERYPNVTVEIFNYNFSPETFAALIADGSLPTLFGVPMTEPQKLIAQGVAADLTPYFEQYGVSDVYIPSLLALVSDADGNIYGLPGFSYTQGLGYNIQMLQDAGFDAPAQTWEELAAQAAALDTDMAQVGFAMNMQGGGGGWHFTNIAYGFGATPEDLVRQNEDGTYTATFGEGPAVEAMQFVQSIREYMPEDLSINPILELVADNAAIAMNPGDGLGWVHINMPDVDLTQYGYAPVPAGPDGTRRSLTGGSTYMILNSASDAEKEAAFVFQAWKELSLDELPATREIFHSTQAGQGAPVTPVYTGAFGDLVAELDAPYLSMPVENYAAYNDALEAGEVVLVPEPLFAQDFYVAIADVLTTVLTDPDADVAQLMADAAAAFQTGVLDAAAQAQ